MAAATVAPAGTVRDEVSDPPPRYVPTVWAVHSPKYVTVQDGIRVQF
jgi:hypothetical protein